MLISLAPMDGITDTAYRVICRRIFQQYGNPKDTLGLRTEFMSADGYIHNPSGVVKHLMTLQSDESSTIAQIFGGNKENLVQCAVDIDKKYGFQGIELNMGCPSPKIMKCEAGSGMLKNKKKTLDIIKEISQSISVPLSLKTRTGLKNDDVQEQFDFLLEASKRVNMISIHGRTYTQGHSGNVNRDFIYKLKAKLPNKIIIGNGGIRSYEDAINHHSPNPSPFWRGEGARGVGVRALDGIMIGQSAIGNPRILTPHKATHIEKIQTILDHLNLSVACEIYFKQVIKKYDKHQKLIQPTQEDLQSIVSILNSYHHSNTSLSVNTTHLTSSDSASDFIKNDKQFNISQTEILNSLPKLKSPIEFRKYLFNYIKGLPESKKLKQTIIKIRDYRSLYKTIQKFFQRTPNTEI